MNRILSFYLIILIVFFAVGAVLEFNSEFAKERELWKIQSQFRRIQNPLLPENEFVLSKVIKKYEKFIAKNKLSPVLPKAYLSYAKALLDLGKIDEARQIYQTIIDQYSYNQDIRAESFYAIGQSYERENNWPKAVTVYRSLIRDYPYTPSGFSTAYYLGNFYLSRGLNSAASVAFDEAVDFYSNAADNFPDSPLGFSSIQMKIKSQIALGRWMDAFYSGKQLMFEYPLSRSISDTIQLIQKLSVQKLGNREFASKVFHEFIKKNPGHPINNVLEQLIEKNDSQKGKQ